MSDEGVVLGCDVGGTFTDFFLLGGEHSRVLKVRSTPAAPQQAVLDGLGRLSDSVERLVHGSTIATNAILERRGAKTALVTTAGFRDVIEIGRQARPRIYEAEPRRPAPLVPRELRFEAAERVRSDGSLEIALDPEDVRRIVQAAKAGRVEALAVCLLFSFLRPEHERLIAEEARRAGLFVSASHEVLPEYREYERTSTTVVNAYVGPVMSAYLQALETGCRAAGVGGLEVMNSAGGVISAEEAGHHAAQTVLSGPAGGVAGAFYAASSAGYDRIISFDMGGTSTDVALCDRELTLQTEASVAGLPVRLPAADVHTVGAGGGSIAWLDDAGSLRVGPQSAGAEPGPAAYGRGDRPTVTDAHLVLGHLPAPLAGSITLDREAAARALRSLAAFETAEQAASGVLRVVTATMERALRVVSLERGHDPRDFTLVPFGGAGPLHACALADALGMRRILVPRHPGVLSAVGMALAPSRWEMPAPVLTTLDSPEAAEAVQSAAARLEAAAAGIAGARQWLADLRYRGQAYELRAPLALPLPAAAAIALREAHQRRYGFVPTGEPEIVNLRLVVMGERGAMPEPAAPAVASLPTLRKAAVYGDGGWREATLADRAALRPGETVAGPAILTQYDCTTLVEEGWQARVTEHGDVVMTPR